MKAIPRIEKPCQTCGAPIFALPKKAERKRFCSRSCLAAENAARMNLTRRSPKEYSRPPVMFGADNPMFTPPLSLACKHCGRAFEKKAWRIRHGHTGEFCSMQCKSAHWREERSGPAAADWVGGAKTYRGRDWRRVRAAVVADQGGCCALCAKHVGASLPVHHIRPFREFATAAEANDRANLVGMCQSCHMRAEPRVWGKLRCHATASSPENIGQSS